MVSQKITKIASLVIALFVLISPFISVDDWGVVGVASNSPLINRLFYHFFHASFIHAVVNAWCLISVVFLFNISFARFASAFIIASVVPGLFLSDIPTVGLSCVCFALLGLISFFTAKPLYWIAYFFSLIAIGSFFSGVNAAIHLYGFVAGIVGALFSSPLSCLIRFKI